MISMQLFVLPHDEIAKYGQQALTYGSLSKKGIKSMIETIKDLMGGEIYGLDLGCGDGELIWHLQADTAHETRWEGVEISEHRVNLQTRDVVIWQGDFLKESFRPYNVLHADNLCLEDSVAEALEIKIAREFTGLYITYRTPEAMEFLKAARHLRTVPTETTWTVHPIQYWHL
jgi:hypothetical protein